MGWLVRVKRDEIKLKQQRKVISKIQFKLGKERRKVVGSLHCGRPGRQVTKWSDMSFLKTELC